MAIERSTKGIQDALFLEWDRLSAGESTPQNAKAAALLANTLVATARLELQYARFVSMQRTVDAMRPPALTMGTHGDDKSAVN